MLLFPFASAWLARLLARLLPHLASALGSATTHRAGKLVAWALLLALGVHPAQAQPSATTRKNVAAPRARFTAQDVFALRSATDVQLSPDGKQLAYVLAAADMQTDRTQRSIWLLDVATGQQRQLVPAPASTPRWSPDGQRLAYLAAEPGHAAQLCVQRLAPATITHLAGLPGTPDNVTWSPDGRTLACTAFVADTATSAPLYRLPVARPATAQWAPPLRVITAVHYRSDGGGDLTPGYTHLFVVAADGTAPPRQLTTGAYNAGQPPAWTPDGRYLLFGANRRPVAERDPNAYDTEIWQVRLADGELTQLTQHAGPDQQPVVSPDGQLIAYISSPLYEHGLFNPQLWVMRRDGSQAHALSAALDRSVDAPHWAADGRRVYVSYDEAGVTKLGAFDLAGRLQPLTERLASSEFSVSRTGTVAFALAASDHPAEVAVWRARSGPRQLTHLTTALLQGKALGQVRPLAVRSSFDQQAVGAWVVTPPDYDPTRRYPAVLVIHGGPYGSYGPEWSTDFQLYAAAGYVVLFANPRGSTSYGTAYTNQIWHDFPSHDADDLLSVVDAAVAQGLADSTRLFLTGGSAGGLLTTWLIGKTTRFRAAVAEKPVINTASQLLLTDQYVGGAEFSFGAFPWEQPQAYWQHSPLSLVGRVRTPTLLLVGEQDKRTPPSEAEQYYAALHLRGIPTALVLVPGASHESLTARPSQHVAEMAVKLAWFARYGGQ
ncbi:MAG: prolyl oligopeptidase family serine peptidase [Janthinobacterium lividum]